MMTRAALLVILSIGMGMRMEAQVVLNEVSVSNYTDQANSFGEYDDWVELYNLGGAPVDLSGWYLSDNPANNTKWAFPAGATIGANGYLVIYCNGRNTSVGNEHHTNFKLNQTDEETVVLSDASANVVSDFPLNVRTQVDHSRGLDMDGTGTWRLFVSPTPGATNTGAVQEYVAEPDMSVAAGVYGGTQTVSLSTSTAGATIRFTLDGSTPTATSPIYAAPIPIGATAVLRARAFSADPAVPASAVETNTYIIGPGHTVAILSIAGNDVQTLMDGTQIQPVGSLEYFGANGVLRDEATGDFNEHGNDSWAYPQRGIDYVSRDQFGDNDAIHYPIFRTSERESYQRLIIKAAASDNYPFETGGAHIRDAFVHALSQVNELRLDERSYEPCVLYVNGQYWGVYEIREKVDDSDYTDEYFDQPEDQLLFLKTWGGTWSEYGGAAAQADWDGLVAYVLANDMGDPAAFAYVDGLLNWKSLVDYIVLNSQVVCMDWLNWNTAWWRGLNPDGDGQRWRYALWDMDATFGHYVNFTGIPDESPAADPCNVEALPNPGDQGHIPIIQKLITENATVHDHYVNRYIDLNNTTFQCDYMLRFLDSLVTGITPEMPAHIARWGGTMAEWEANVQAMRDFITTRCVAITQGLQDCYDITGPFPVVFNVDPPLSGTLAINSIEPATYPFSGQYYGNINTTLAPIPGPGWIFSHWEVFSTNTILPSVTDSLVTVDILAADSIVAHFEPPTRYDIVLDVDPPGSARINFFGNWYGDLPATVSVAEGTTAIFHADPAMFFDFSHWSVNNCVYTPDDSTLIALTATFMSTDTLVAHLNPQQIALFVPNAFSPNGDGINDLFLPVNNVIERGTYAFEIFDRWGATLHASTDPGEAWDGTAGGHAVPIGVYAYRASATDAITGERIEQWGHLTIVR